MTDYLTNWLSEGAGQLSFCQLPDLPLVAGAEDVVARGLLPAAWMPPDCKPRVCSSQ